MAGRASRSQGCQEAHVFTVTQLYAPNIGRMKEYLTSREAVVPYDDAHAIAAAMLIFERLNEEATKCCQLLFKKKTWRIKMIDLPKDPRWSVGV